MAKNKQLYLRNGVWWARVKIEDRTERKSTGCRDYQAAEMRLKELERRAADPVSQAASEASFQAAADKLIANVNRAGKAAGTVSMYLVKAGHLLRIFGDCKLVEINASKVESYVNTRLEEGAQTNTIGKELTTLRRILKLAKHKGEFAADIKALMPFDFAANYKPRVRFLKDYSELQALLLQLPRERAAHVCYMVATGARLSESVKAQRSDINLEAGTILLRGSKTKRSLRHVPILDLLRPALNVVLEVVPANQLGPMFPPWSHVGHTLPSACRRAKVAKVTPNDLRRTAATWLRTAGVEPTLIGAFLGHEDGRMVEKVYGRMTVENLARAMSDRLSGQTPVNEPLEAQETPSARCARFVPADPLKIRTDGVAEVAKLNKIKNLSAQGRNRTADTGIFNPLAQQTEATGSTPLSGVSGTAKRSSVSGLYAVRPVKPRTKRREANAPAKPRKKPR